MKPTLPGRLFSSSFLIDILRVTLGIRGTPLRSGPSHCPLRPNGLVAKGPLPLHLSGGGQAPGHLRSLAVKPPIAVIVYPVGVAPLGHGKRDGARRIQVIRIADDAVDGGRVRSEAKLNEALRDRLS